MAEIILLGPQRRIPTFHSVLKALGVEGLVSVITAGWQEREGEVEELKGYANRDLTDLMLYHRSEEVFQRDPELFEAHRQRQTRLQELQRYYRLRLGHALEATRELLREEGDSPLLASERRAALAIVRGVDRHHLRQICQIHADFQQIWRPVERPVVSVERRQLARLLQKSCALLIAGGHVASLLSRLRLFDLGGLLTDKPIIAWSAGAMALSEKIVLFHDHPPQGAGDAEVLDLGLGVFPRVLPLPHARRRLQLDDTLRVSLFAKRFAPMLCVTLDDGAIFHWDDERVSKAQSVSRLTRNGGLAVMEAA